MNRYYIRWLGKPHYVVVGWQDINRRVVLVLAQRVRERLLGGTRMKRAKVYGHDHRRGRHRHVGRHHNES